MASRIKVTWNTSYDMILGQAWEFSLFHSGGQLTLILKTGVQIVLCLIIAWVAHALIVVILHAVCSRYPGSKVSCLMMAVVRLPQHAQFVLVMAILIFCIFFAIADRMLYGHYARRASIIEHEIIGKPEVEVIRLLGEPNQRTARTLHYRCYRPQIDSVSFVMSGIHREEFVVELTANGIVKGRHLKGGRVISATSEKNVR